MTEQNQPSINARPRIRVNGGVRAELDSALLDLMINLPLSGMAHAELRLVNWQSNSSDSGADFAFQSLTHGTEINILAGDSDDNPLFSGEITALEERYGKGAPQLVILAEDKLHRLARVRENRTFEDTGLNDVLQSLVSELGLSADIQVSDYSATWHQLNESNLAFIGRLLAPYDIALRIDSDTVRVRSEEADPEPVVLDPQNNVQQLRITADLNHQSTGVQVRGFDLSADATSDGSDSSAPAGSGETAADLLGRLSWGQEEIVAMPFARAQAEAADWAAGRFAHTAKKFLYGDILCTGIPQLKAGREVELEGVSSRLAGVYQVVDCVHQFNNNQGYTTRLKVQRGNWNNG